MTSPITTCFLVGALGAFIAGEIFAGGVIVGACAVFEFFLPNLVTPTQTRDGVKFE